MTLYAPAEHQIWSLDADGVPFAIKNHDDQLPYTLYLADWLGSDTISGAPVWEMFGPTKVSESNTTTTLTITITGTGDAQATVTTAAGRKRVFLVRWVASDRAQRAYGR